MKLSAFLLLLKGVAFIPLLRKLQETDPKEMRIATGLTEKELVLESAGFEGARHWLKENKLSLRFDRDRCTQNEHDDDGQLLDEWRYQLSARRCAWCWFDPRGWHSHPMDSMAMWNLYAREGVAIKTTLAGIVAAVQEPGLDIMVVSPVDYGGLNTDLEFAKRPFFFKSGSYDYEKEVRLVVRVNAEVVASGIKVRLDPTKLLDREEVLISPYLQADEAHAIEDVAREMLAGADVTFRLSPERCAGAPVDRSDIEWTDGLMRHVGQFSAEEGLPELLQEL